MYLAKVIDRCFEDNRNKFKGFVSHRALIRRLNTTFKSLDNLKFKSVKYDDLDVNDYLIGGLYDQNTDIKYILINLSTYCDEIYFEDYMWSDFKFGISQTIQHEAIHQLQFQHRANRDESVKIDFRVRQEDLGEEREYLSDMDEIDAYAHDIAMEIKYFYPRSDPYDILKTISYKRKLSAYRYYTKTFKGCDWSKIKRRLLLKTYKWIPHA